MAWFRRGARSPEDEFADEVAALARDLLGAKVTPCGEFSLLLELQRISRAGAWVAIPEAANRTIEIRHCAFIIPDKLHFIANYDPKYESQNQEK